MKIYSDYKGPRLSIHLHMCIKILLDDNFDDILKHILDRGSLVKSKIKLSDLFTKLSFKDKCLAHFWNI